MVTDEDLKELQLEMEQMRAAFARDATAVPPSVEKWARLLEEVRQRRESDQGLAYLFNDGRHPAQLAVKAETWRAAFEFLATQVRR